MAHELFFPPVPEITQVYDFKLKDTICEGKWALDGSFQPGFIYRESGMSFIFSQLFVLLGAANSSAAVLWEKPGGA